MYLIKRGELPVTALGVRKAIGLQSTAFDMLITAGIASVCAVSSRPVTHETWLIADLEDPTRFGIPSTDGVTIRGYGNDTRVFRAYTYAPDLQAIADAFAAAQRWALNQHDIWLQLQAEKGE